MNREGIVEYTKRRQGRQLERRKGKVSNPNKASTVSSCLPPPLRLPLFPPSLHSRGGGNEVRILAFLLS